VSKEILEVSTKKSEIGLVVWAVPIIALVVAGWLIYKYYSSLGPLITISFKNSGGLEPKQSSLRFRDVKVGSVEKIEILKEKEGVIVYVRVNKDVEPFLNEHAKFWIVKPEIGLDKVRGLDALMSGAYIQLESKLGGEPKRHFQGLEEPPLKLEEEKGDTFVLHSPQSYELVAGSPVYFKQMKVGKVKKVELSKDAKEVKFYIFVQNPYDKLINSTTKFWNIRGIDMSLDSEGVKVQMGSISQLIVGGIEFDTKDLSQGVKVSDSFYLYPSKKEAFEKKLGFPKEDYRLFLMEFNTQTGYLNVDAPVKFEGYKIGTVEDVHSYLDINSSKIVSQVLVRIDVSAFNKDGKGIEGLKKAVAKGLKAKLEKPSFLTKSLIIELVFKGEGKELVKKGEYYLFPTLPYKKNRLLKLTEELVIKLKNIPIERSLDALSNLFEENSQPLKKALEKISLLSHDLHSLFSSKPTQELPKELNKTLGELQNALKTYNELAKGYKQDSIFGAQVSQTLKDVDEAAQSLQKLLLKLDKKPNALIFGD